MTIIWHIHPIMAIEFYRDNPFHAFDLTASQSLELVKGTGRMENLMLAARKGPIHHRRVMRAPGWAVRAPARFFIHLISVRARLAGKNSEQSHSKGPPQPDHALCLGQIS